MSPFINVLKRSLRGAAVHWVSAGSSRDADAPTSGAGPRQIAVARLDRTRELLTLPRIAVENERAVAVGRACPLDQGDATTPSPVTCARTARRPQGIVKLTKRSSIDRQYTGLQPVANPPCWASETAVSLNLTIPLWQRNQLDDGPSSPGPTGSRYGER